MAEMLAGYDIDARSIATLAAALITSGFFYGGIKFLFRSRAESGAIIVKSAEGVVVLQATIIKELKAENEQFKKENAELKKMVERLREDLEEAKGRLAYCEKHIDTLEGK